MDIDRLEDEIEELREIRRELMELYDRAAEVNVELDEAEITKRIEAGEKLAEAYRRADTDALKRMYEVMCL